MVQQIHLPNFSQFFSSAGTRTSRLADVHGARVWVSRRSWFMIQKEITGRRWTMIYSPGLNCVCIYPSSNGGEVVNPREEANARTSLETTINAFDCPFYIIYIIVSLYRSRLPSLITGSRFVSPIAKRNLPHNVNFFVSVYYPVYYHDEEED